MTEPLFLYIDHYFIELDNDASMIGVHDGYNILLDLRFNRFIYPKFNQKSLTPTLPIVLQQNCMCNDVS